MAGLPDGEALILVRVEPGVGALDGAYAELHTRVATQCDATVRSCDLTRSGRTLAITLQQAAGARRVVVLPLMCENEHAMLDAIAVEVAAAQRRWPGCQWRVAEPLLAERHLVGLLRQRARAALLKAGASDALEGVALLVAGTDAGDSAANAWVARLAYLLGDGAGDAIAIVAFATGAAPDIVTGLMRWVRLGARQVVVLGLGLLGGLDASATAQLAAAQARFSTLPILIAAPPGTSVGVAAVVLQRYATACAGDNSEPSTLQSNRRAHRHAHESADIPTRYQPGRAIPTTTMGSAPLRYSDDGTVAWDQLWGHDDDTAPFCDLALDGGPPHRGTLLEPVDARLVQADPAGYDRVVNELERGLRLVTGWPTVRGVAAGWVGLVCPDEPTALWLLRAIVAENVSVRREAATLYLPAGPTFRLEGEIKNVITAVAKTHHYWQAHRTERAL